MRPLAIISLFNDADILPAVLRHLEQQGCEVYLLDNWSTDLSPELLAALKNNGERWPAQRPTTFELTEILTRIEEIALERGKGRWIILHDADEIRRVPNEWACLTLEKALENVTAAGYNAVQFAVRTYVPTDNLWKAGDNPERHFRHHRSEHVDHGLPHVKAWFQGNERVDLHTHGGHQAVFSNRAVCPISFILKHYPIRSQEHGERKVLKERLPRYPLKERSKKWHVQYDEYATEPKPNFLANPEDLTKDRNNTAIVTLTRSPKMFNRFAESIEKHDPSYRRIVVALDGVRIDRPGWEEVTGGGFSFFARNFNLGVRAAGTDDVLFARDDIEFTGPVVEDLSDISYLTSAAIVSPEITSEGGIAASANRSDNRWRRHTLSYISFLCVLLRRAVLDSLGGLDEGFSGYGSEDAEYGSRAFRRGLPLIVSHSRVRQDYERRPLSVSFSQVVSKA